MNYPVIILCLFPAIHTALYAPVMFYALRLYPRRLKIFALLCVYVIVQLAYRTIGLMGG